MLQRLLTRRNLSSGRKFDLTLNSASKLPNWLGYWIDYLRCRVFPVFGRTRVITSVRCNPILAHHFTDDNTLHGDWRSESILVIRFLVCALLSLRRNASLAICSRAHKVVEHRLQLCGLFGLLIFGQLLNSLLRGFRFFLLLFAASGLLLHFLGCVHIDLLWL